jgi:NADH:ubiquinone oxidoreductase subunit H
MQDFQALSFVWFISCLDETNRTPFDFAEGEYELVSALSMGLVGLLDIFGLEEIFAFILELSLYFL